MSHFVVFRVRRSLPATTGSRRFRRAASRHPSFHKSQHIEPRHGRLSFSASKIYYRWCFSDFPTARAGVWYLFTRRTHSLDQMRP